MPTRPALLVLHATLLATLLAGCAAGTEAETSPAAGSTPPATPSAAATGPVPEGTSAPTASTTPSVAPAPAVRTIDVAYTGGEVTGTDGREDVALGEQVVLRLTSDVAEEVHVHGYDLQQALPAGVPVEVPLTATVPGGFEVELHDSGRVLFQLRVA